MFSNLIYLIIVLLFYNIYHPPEQTSFSGIKTLLLWGGMVVLFVLLNQAVFRRIERDADWQSPARLDHRFSAAMQRHSILAIALFVVSIYLLNLPDFLRALPPLNILPTLLAAIFLGLFIGYLTIVWHASFPLHRKLYMPDESLREHITSHIRFSLPILLPWFVLSAGADLLDILPLRQPAAFFATTLGQVVYFLFFMFTIAMVGPLLVQKFWGCRPLPEGPMRDRIAAVCRRADLRYADILFWPIHGGRMITAGVMGLVHKFRYLLVTDALLQYLQPAEIEAVIAHEIGHIKQKHLLFYLVFFSGYMLLALVIFDMLLFLLYFSETLNRLVDALGVPLNTALSGIFSLIVILIFLIYFRYIFGWFMRNFERQADTFVYRLFDSAQPLITTLEKIAQTSGHDADKPNWHHFSIARRIGFLQRCEFDRNWIYRHNAKIRRGLMVYGLSLLLVVLAGYSLNYGAAGDHIREHVQARVLLRHLESAPDNAELLGLLGDYHQLNGKPAAAIEAYRQALQADPRDAQVLNNLAWLYVTTDVPSLRDPVQALELARQAVAIEPAAHILDTLAESYHANGHYQQAWQYARRALEAALAAGDDTDYYLKQLARFEKALE